MPRTNLEKRLSKRQQDGLLLPLLNKLLEKPVAIDTPADAEFLHALSQKQIMREQQRKTSYESGVGVFSPSSLASCLRRSFLSKNHREYGLERVELPNIEPHYYFITGDFVHLKLQFLLYRVAVEWPERFVLVDTELPVSSKRSDHAGTVDSLVLLDGEPLIVDFKGLNVRSFNAIDRGELPGAYRIQLADYMMLFNAMLESGRWKPDKMLLNYLRIFGHDKMPPVKRALLLAENKGGPDANHPSALTECIVDFKENLPEVRLRLEVLRAHEESKEIPDAECESTRLIEFTGCPFASFCFKEVRERETKRIEASDSSEFRLAKPTGRNRSRRSGYVR